MDKIQVCHVSKNYGNKKVLEDLTLTFNKGHLYCLMGASGIGKTTLLRLLLGLEKPDEGSILGMPSKIAAVFQEDRLCESFHVLANIQLGTGSSVPLDHIQNCLDQLGIGETLYTPVHTLSGGMKRRVALARALLAKSECLILDEPFKGLDEELKSKIYSILPSYWVNKTVILVTHDRKEAECLQGEIIEFPLS